MATDYSIEIDRNLCLECAGCVGICPPGALTMEGLELQYHQSECVACDDCVIFCPVGALAVGSAEAVP